MEQDEEKFGTLRSAISGEPKVSSGQQQLKPPPVAGLKPPAAPAAPAAPPAASTQTIAGTPAPAQNPYSRGPSGFVNFQQYLGANGQAAKASADKVNAKVRGDAQGAMDKLQNAYGSFADDVQRGVNTGMYARGKGSDGVEGATGQYNGPRAFDVSGLEDDFKSAQSGLAGLGTEGGVDELLGPGRDWFSSALTSAAGRKDFQDTQKQFAGLSSALSDSAARGKDYADAASKRVSDYYGEIQPRAIDYGEIQDELDREQRTYRDSPRQVASPDHEPDMDAETAAATAEALGVAPTTNTTRRDANGKRTTDRER